MTPAPIWWRYDPDSRWVDILAVETGWSVCNMEQNGREIPSAAPLPSPTETDLLIVMLRTNDLLQGRSPEQAAESVGAVPLWHPLGSKQDPGDRPRCRWSWAWVPDQQLVNDSRTFERLCQALAEQLGIRFADAGKWDIPWPMMAYTSRSRGTRPLPPDFWRNSNEANPAYTLSLLLLTGCGGNSADGYQQITQEEAKEMMDTQEVIILDVRGQDEYDNGRIPGAVLLPVGKH